MARNASVKYVYYSTSTMFVLQYPAFNKDLLLYDYLTLAPSFMKYNCFWVNIQIKASVHYSMCAWWKRTGNCVRKCEHHTTPMKGTPLCPKSWLSSPYFMFLIFRITAVHTHTFSSIEHEFEHWLYCLIRMVVIIVLIISKTIWWEWG